MEERQTGSCVYIIKTGKNLYKIGKTKDLQKRLASYHTHLPILFRVVRQYPCTNMAELEESLHIVFQHKRTKGEWFELHQGDLLICDNIARNFAFQKLRKNTTAYRVIDYSDEPLLQVMEANEKYLRDYSRIAEDIKIGLSTEEIFTMHDGVISKTVIDTVRRLLKYRTPNAEFLTKWLPVVIDMRAGLTEQQLLEKYKGEISRNTVQMIKRILRNQLY